MCALAVPSDAVTAPAHASRPARWAWVPVPLFLLGIIGLWTADLRASYEAPNLLSGLNFAFSTLAALAVAFLFGRVFVARPAPGMLLVGCGVLIWGVGSFLASAVARGDGNILVSIHNLCVWLGAGAQLGGVLLLRRESRTVPTPGLWVGAAYSGSLAIVGLVALGALRGWLPLFFVEGKGGTLVREFVLGSAIVMLVLTTTGLRPVKGAVWSTFAYWYALALVLLAVGLFGVMVQAVHGSLLGWAGRAAQFLGGAYMLVAAVASARKQDLVTLAPTTGRSETWQRYLVAVAVVIAATVLRLVLLEHLGLRVTFITFYPAVILAALYGGLGPGLLATVLSALFAKYLWMEPVGALAVKNFYDGLALGLFGASGALISYVTEVLHRAQARVAVMTEQARQAAERERAERALREMRREKEFLASVLERAAQPFAIGYPDGRVGLVNRAYEELTGYTAQELRTIDWTTVLTPPEWREAERQKLADLHLTGQPVRYEKENLRKDGTRVPVELLVHLARDAAGQPDYYYSFLTDISDRKRAEAAVRASEDRLRFALEASHTGAWDLDLADHTAVRSLEHDRVFGYSELLPEWTYEVFLEHVLPEDRAAVDEEFKQAMTRGSDWSFECRIRRTDGEVR